MALCEHIAPKLYLISPKRALKQLLNKHLFPLLDKLAQPRGLRQYGNAALYS